MRSASVEAAQLVLAGVLRGQHARTLRWLNRAVAQRPFNGVMPAHTPPTNDAQRAAMLRFEVLYEAWRLADERLLQAEQRVLAESFNRKGADVPPELAQEVARLRGLANEAHRQVLAARDEMDGGA